MNTTRCQRVHSAVWVNPSPNARQMALSGSALVLALAHAARTEDARGLRLELSAGFRPCSTGPPGPGQLVPAPRDIAATRPRTGGSGPTETFASGQRALIPSTSSPFAKFCPGLRLTQLGRVAMPVSKGQAEQQLPGTRRGGFDSALLLGDDRSPGGIRFSRRLVSHPVCRTLTSGALKGGVSGSPSQGP